MRFATAITMEIALTAADTGHLVLSTLHTIDATQTINRIISFFEPHQHQEVRYLLATTLQAVISQRFIRERTTGLGPGIPAVEVMIVDEPPSVSTFSEAAEDER